MNARCALALLVWAAGVAGASATCTGDCDADCQVTVDEVLTLVAAGVGTTPARACPAGDRDEDGRVTVDEIVAAVDGALGGCDSGACAGPDPGCGAAAGEGVRVDLTQPACERLSSYRLFRGDLLRQQPNDGVLPYELVTELWSDGAAKHRFVWMPDGTSAAYDPNEAFSFPVGTVLVKTFAFPADERDPNGPEDLLETRLLVHRPEGWVGLPYVWNEDESEATLRRTGARLDVATVDVAGGLYRGVYEVPNANQCKTCHDADGGGMAPLGPKARNLNRAVVHGDGTAHQLALWAASGRLAGLPADLDRVPAAVALDDARRSIAERARSYLDVNCGHCHNPRGAARPTGLFLAAFETDPLRLGRCKNPTAAGQGTGGRPHIVDPGAPDNSVLVFRVESTDPVLRMPELGRSRVDAAAVAVLRAWIGSMEGECVLR